MSHLLTEGVIKALIVLNKELTEALECLGTDSPTDKKPPAKKPRKAKTAPPEEAITEEVAEEPAAVVVSIEDCRGALMKVAEKFGAGEATRIVAAFNVDKLSGLPEDKYVDLLTVADEKLNTGVAA